jgi:hypothetical protein
MKKKHMTDDAARLRELFRALPVDPPDEMRVRRVRASILHAAAHPGAAPSPRGSRWVSVLAAAALVASLTVWLFPISPLTSPGGAVTRGANDESATVTPSLGAVWSRDHDGAIDRVRLQDGSLSLEVRHRRPGERFLVELPDGELEVRGTRFEVNVEARVTAHVRVFEGRVALRRTGEAELVLGAGESWVRPKAIAPTASSEPSSKPATARATPTVAPPTVAPPTDLHAYADAMALYRAGRFEQAARSFRAFVAAHPDEPEAEDAAFLEAAALAQAGRGDAAGLVAEQFLERHPSSFHARDAAILVARAARERGDCDTARRALSPWLASPTPVVTAALGRCGAAP